MPAPNLFEQDHVVVKANDLVKAKSNFTRLEHRVIAMMIARLKKSDQEFKLQRVYVKDLLELSGTNYDAIYERMEDVCDKLLNQQIKIRTRDESNRRVYQGFNYFETCRYVEGSGYIEAQIHAVDEAVPSRIEGAVYDVPAAAFHETGIILQHARLRNSKRCARI